MIESKEIKRYTGKSIPQLIKIAERHFNKFIRERDRQGLYFYCPTCDNTKIINGDNYHACHLFPAGSYGWLRFDEDNVHGGCKSCNYFKHGSGHSYVPYVQRKIGIDRFGQLEQKNAYFKANSFKWDRFSLIDIIIKYKNHKITSK